MMPSDMSIINGKTNNFNNKLLISSDKLNIGAVNALINTSQPKHAAHINQDQILPPHEMKASKEHNEEIQAVVIVGAIIGVLAIAGIIYYRYRKK